MVDFNCGHETTLDKRVRMYDPQGRIYESCSEGCRDMIACFYELTLSRTPPDEEKSKELYSNLERIV